MGGINRSIIKGTKENKKDKRLFDFVSFRKKDEAKHVGIWSYTGAKYNSTREDKLFKRLIDLDEKLRAMHGDKVNPLDESIMEGLIHIVLTQNTSDVNSDRTFAKLMEDFKSFIEMKDASKEQISESIKMGGLSKIKAERIKRLLNLIYEANEGFDLSFLLDLAPDDAMEYLMKYDGVGPKSAACALLFATNVPVFPVDTHVHRVLNRLGILCTKSPDKTQRSIAPYVREDLVYSLHVNLVHHGRKICKAIRPRCDQCVLKSECSFALNGE